MSSQKCNSKNKKIRTHIYNIIFKIITLSLKSTLLSGKVCHWFYLSYEEYINLEHKVKT